ncbi:MAG: YwoA, partial [Candidatus Saccharibacteria bacterium]|nr:YwoA [Candidatus Saccharibacteria bacterium]
PMFNPPDYNGFPSDHTLFAAVVAFGVLRFSKKLGIGLLIVTLLVGWGRVAAHVHHLVDIVGAIVAAALAYFIVLRLLPRLQTARKSSQHTQR